MNVEMNKVRAGTIQEFADEYGLTMKICERELPDEDPARYYAQFESGEIKDGGILAGEYGNGATPKQAVEDYANQISMKLLVVDAFKPSRREIKCWRFISETEKASNDLIEAAIEFSEWIPSQLSDPDYDYSHEYGDEARKLLEAVRKYKARKAMQ